MILDRLNEIYYFPFRRRVLIQNVTVRILKNNLFNFAIGILNPFLDQKLPVGMFSILRSRIIPNILEYLCAFQIFHAFRTCEKYIISLNLPRRKILYPRKKHSQDFQVPEKGPSFSGHLRMTFRRFSNDIIYRQVAFCGLKV